MSIRDNWRAFWESFALAIELKATELRTGITLIEAAEIDAFETDLRMVTLGTEERTDIRLLAIYAAQVGLVSDDVGPMARAYFLSKAKD